MQSPSRRDALRGAAAAAAGALVLQPARQTMAATPEPQKVTPELIAAARKEGKVSFYTSVELSVAQNVARAFETKFPGVSVRVERTVPVAPGRVSLADFTRADTAPRMPPPKD